MSILLIIIYFAVYYPMYKLWNKENDDIVDMSRIEKAIGLISYLILWPITFPFGLLYNYCLKITR